MTAVYMYSVYQSGHSGGFSKIGWAISSFRFTFIIWLVGLVLFGSPVWFWLHVSGRREWYHALIAGFVVPFTILIALSTGFFTGRANGKFSAFAQGGQQWVDGVITQFGLYIAVFNAVTFGAMGAAIALFIWRVAYRRQQ